MKKFLLDKWNALGPIQQAWCKGLLAAAEGAVTGFVAQWMADPSTVNLHDWRHLVGAIGGAVFQAVRQYMRQSPIPRQVWTDEQRNALSGQAPQNGATK